MTKNLPDQPPVNSVIVFEVTPWYQVSTGVWQQGGGWSEEYSWEELLAVYPDKRSFTYLREGGGAPSDAETVSWEVLPDEPPVGSVVTFLLGGSSDSWTFAWTRTGVRLSMWQAPEDPGTQETWVSLLKRYGLTCGPSELVILRYGYDVDRVQERITL